MFVYRSAVFFDELDLMAMLHNARYAVHVEHATSALYESPGFQFATDAAENPDQIHAVRHFEVDLRRPFVRPGELEVRLWVSRMGKTSCRYGFACLGPEGVEHATGQRVIVKLDPVSLRPVPWSERFRQAHRQLLGENHPDAG